ncbi:L-threonylcarbamoyladenylate synthase [Aquipuribacter nitratireducens]|uniref:Threonylcarbamoyl-AMP synthase n=1 Tax=Aquipuribacter nitratireducens TaxID=650104 RepID=A0ABW0GQS1_9MICO
MDVAAAAALLRAGGLVAFPTETVYGLGAHALDERAVRRVFAVKGRPADNPLIVHVASLDEVGAVAASVPDGARRLAERYWPGPLTLVLAARPEVPAVTRGGRDSIAVRVPAHPLALDLLRAAAVPVAAPSANRSGRPSPTTAAHVRADLGDDVDAVLDGGPCEVGVESTVVDARGAVPVVLREGAVPADELGAVAGSAAQLGASPGTRHRHYAPRCRVVVASAGEGGQVSAALAGEGHRVALVSPGGAPDGVLHLAAVAEPADLARRLYALLRAAEDAAVDVVVVEAVPEEGVGRAVMDRLRRAADAGG